MVENKATTYPKMSSGLIGTVSCTTRTSKDSKIRLMFNVGVPQRDRIILALREPTEMGKTMLMVARETGVERANICRRIAELREDGRVWECGCHICRVSNARAMYYTTNYRVCLNHFVQSTKSVWERYGMCVQVRLLNAIKEYVIDHKTDVEIFGLGYDDVREIWEREVKPIIDGELR